MCKTNIRLCALSLHIKSIRKLLQLRNRLLHCLLAGVVQAKVTNGEPGASVSDWSHPQNRHHGRPGLSPRRLAAISSAVIPKSTVGPTVAPRNPSGPLVAISLLTHSISPLRPATTWNWSRLICRSAGSWANKPSAQASTSHEVMFVRQGHVDYPPLHCPHDIEIETTGHSQSFEHWVRTWAWDELDQQFRVHLADTFPDQQGHDLVVTDIGSADNDVNYPQDAGQRQLVVRRIENNRPAPRNTLLQCRDVLGKETLAQKFQSGGRSASHTPQKNQASRTTFLSPHLPQRRNTSSVVNPSRWVNPARFNAAATAPQDSGSGQ